MPRREHPGYQFSLDRLLTIDSDTPGLWRTAKALSAAKTAKSGVSPDKWAARVNLAAAYRLVGMRGWGGGIYNHISMRVPGEPNRFLIKLRVLLYEELTASPGDMILTGTPSGAAYPYGPFLKVGDRIDAEIDHLGSPFTGLAMKDEDVARRFVVSATSNSRGSSCRAGTPCLMPPPRPVAMSQLAACLGPPRWLAGGQPVVLRAK